MRALNEQATLVNESIFEILANTESFKKSFKYYFYIHTHMAKFYQQIDNIVKLIEKELTIKSEKEEAFKSLDTALN